jgi:hypothetical protein
MQAWFIDAGERLAQLQHDGFLRLMYGKYPLESQERQNQNSDERYKGTFCH